MGIWAVHSFVCRGLRTLIQWVWVWESLLVLDVDVLRRLQLFSWVYSRKGVDISIVVLKLVLFL